MVSRCRRVMRSFSGVRRSAYCGKNENTGASRSLSQPRSKAMPVRSAVTLFRDRVNIVLRACIARFFAQHLTGRELVSESEVVFVYKDPVPCDDNPVGIGLLPTFEARADGADQLGVEPLLLRRRNRPAVLQLSWAAAAGRILSRYTGWDQHQNKHERHDPHRCSLGRHSAVRQDDRRVPPWSMRMFIGTRKRR